MKKTKVYSVRLKSLTPISAKAYMAEDWQGNTAILPKSQYFGIDHEVQKSDAYWIAAWILEKEELNYSKNKVGFYNHTKGYIEPPIEVIKVVPEKVVFDPNVEPENDLLK